MVLSEDGAGSKVRSRDGNLADFFEPTANGVARTPEGARKTSEARALLVSVQDLLTSLWRIGVRAGILAALPAAIMAEVLLFAIWSFAVLDDVFAFAVIAGDDLSNHSSILSFGLEPLPGEVSPQGVQRLLNTPKWDADLLVREDLRETMS